MAMVTGTIRAGNFPHLHSQSIRHGQQIRKCRQFYCCISGPQQSRSASCSSLPKKSLSVAVPASLVGLNLGLESTGSVIEAMGVLAVIIFVHESGHFLAARLQNIHVTKFSIGFGPKLAKFQGKDVEYSLRAIPLGGYVGFPDDDPESEFTADDPDLLKNRPILDRVLVMSAGVAANVVFAYSLLFTQALSVGFLQQKVLPGVFVPEVSLNSAASKAGIRAGDVILAVDGKPLPASEQLVLEVVDVIKEKPGQKISLVVMRNQEPVNIDIFPERSKDGRGKIGVQLSANVSARRVKARDLAEATVQATSEFGKLSSRVVDGLKQIVLNFAQSASKLSGPVAIVAFGAEVARSDVAGLFQFAAILNINLAVVNILPLPALDGGYLALIALEALRGGKKLPNKVEQGIMSSGILLILALGLVLMVRDTLNLGFMQERL